LVGAFAEVFGFAGGVDTLEDVYVFGGGVNAL
jgi:hypothetical protein